MKAESYRKYCEVESMYPDAVVLIKSNDDTYKSFGSSAEYLANIHSKMVSMDTIKDIGEIRSFSIQSSSVSDDIEKCVRLGKKVAIIEGVDNKQSEINRKFA